jgi:uncharacterized membrane protein YedE/YeeE
MKHIKYLIIGVLFGITMTKSEAVSWYRIQEMFRFQAFHMYGIIGSALVIGVIGVLIMKKQQMKSLSGEALQFKINESGFSRYLLGGIVFGLGWALSGACPGPMYTLLGSGFSVFIVVILSAVLGALLYGVLKNKLPH